MRRRKQKRDDSNQTERVTGQEKPKYKKLMEPTDEENGDLLASGDGGEAKDNKLLQKLSAISTNIRDFPNDIHSAISDLKVDLKKDFKDELATLRHELTQKLADVGTRLQGHDLAITEAEERISDMETSGAATKEALLSLLKEHHRLQEKVTDLESRSRRNNIRVYGVSEGSEGDSMIKFMENLLTTELALPDGMSLQIQRAHRALTQKPGPDATPRSIVINFQQYDVKETVLKLAWKKKIHLNNKPIFFDHDYAYEVMEKRRAYGGIKKVLKEKGIRFQTPFTRIRIHWSTGPRTYEDAHQAAQELRARGMEVSAARVDPAPNLEERIQKAFPWQRVASGGKQMQTRVKEKLQEFRRPPTQL